MTCVGEASALVSRPSLADRSEGRVNRQGGSDPTVVSGTTEGVYSEALGRLSIRVGH